MKVIAYDFGTSGIKASLYNDDGMEIVCEFNGYETDYPQKGWHEQKPKDWFESLVASTRGLIKKYDGDTSDIKALSISGHSLGAVPIDKYGNLLRTSTPIWSDSRAKQQADDFFEKYSYEDWYMKTGNGFPPHLYTIFKIKWYQENEPDMFIKTYKILGTKDYINFLLTGEIYTDYSYASGSGVYNLLNWGYDDELINLFDIDKNILPQIVDSTHVIGEVSVEMSEYLGLPLGIKVVCGGVDNSCMALGAKGICEGRVYTSLGSSAWIAINSEKPVIDIDNKPFVFAHCIKGMYTSATSIFSAGTSYAWVQNTLCKDIVDKYGDDRFAYIDEIASKSPVGANKLIFNPSLAGGSGIDYSDNMRGFFLGLDLKHTQGDILRATLEGIAINLRVALDCLEKVADVDEKMLIVGGGSKSEFWRSIFADVYGMDIEKTNIDQSAGSLGAAALALVGIGAWHDFSKIDDVHKTIDTRKPNKANKKKYEKLLRVFSKFMKTSSKCFDEIYKLKL